MPTTTPPYSSIVLINVRFGNDTYIGSGVMIAADEVLTTTSLIYNRTLGNATSLVVAPGYDRGLTPYGVIAGTVTHYNELAAATGQISLASINKDYAVIKLATPTNSGFLSLGPTFSSGSLTVSGYAIGGNGDQINAVEPVSPYPGAPGVLIGDKLGLGSSGGPLYTGSGVAAQVVGLVSTEDANSQTGYFKQFTYEDRTTIRTWVALDHGINPVVSYSDVNGQSGVGAMMSSETGPSYLEWQYIWASDAGVAMATSAPNAFIRGGAGQDAISVTSGTNVLDGGTGSNFLTGGSGLDTFFTDARSSAVVWNTLRNFHAGDAATIWGFVPGISSYRWEPGVAGAPGNEGATLRVNIIGGAGRSGDGIDASVTFTGISVERAQSLQLVTGTQPAGSYLYVYNPGV